MRWIVNTQPVRIMFKATGNRISCPAGGVAQPKAKRVGLAYRHAWLAAAFGFGFISSGFAQFDASRVKPQLRNVAEQYPDPSLTYDTPGLQPGRQDFATHVDVLTFIEALALRSARVKVEVLGMSQQGRSNPLVVLTGSAGLRKELPTILILGQQHGNEPAGGEAALAIAQQIAVADAALLEGVNVLIMPRANPDGADRFARVTASGADVNRDHLLLRTPEAQHIANVVRQYRPQVVLDLHEFTVGDRWVAKFGVLQKYDALVQAATVGNMSPAIAAAQKTYVEAVQRALIDAGQTPFWYFTTSGDAKDKMVAMGGVQPDTGRNVNGLRQAISLLIETRGVGLGRHHFKRRVHGHVVAALAVIKTAANQGSALVAMMDAADAQVADLACRGELVIRAQHSLTRQTLDFWDATTGAPRSLEVVWRSALDLRVDLQRPRPCGYLVAGSQAQALDRLRALGVQMRPASEFQSSAPNWAVERFEVLSTDDGKRQDARGAIEDGDDVRVFAVRTVPAQLQAQPGSFYVSLAQPLSALISAALEPDSQNSYAANSLLNLGEANVLRVMQVPKP